MFFIGTETHRAYSMVIYLNVFVSIDLFHFLKIEVNLKIKWTLVMHSQIRKFWAFCLDFLILKLKQIFLKNLWERLTENCLAQRFFWYDFNTSVAHRAIKIHIMRNLKNVSSSWGFLKDFCSELFPLPTFFKLLNAGQILNAGKHLSSFFFQLNEYL